LSISLLHDLQSQYIIHPLLLIMTFLHVLPITTSHTAMADLEGKLEDIEKRGKKRKESKKGKEKKKDVFSWVDNYSEEEAELEADDDKKRQKSANKRKKREEDRQRMDKQRSKRDHMEDNETSFHRRKPSTLGVVLRQVAPMPDGEQHLKFYKY